MTDARASYPMPSGGIATPLLRPSQLARFWELHPKTLYVWIREGKLPAVRTPGDQFRLRGADIRAFAEAAGLPVPPFVLTPLRRALVSVAAGVFLRALRRTLKDASVGVEAHDRALDAIFAAIAAPPALLVLDASTAARGTDLPESLAALRRQGATAQVPVVVVNAPTANKAAALVRAGATRAHARGRERDALPQITSLLA